MSNRDYILSSYGEKADFLISLCSEEMLAEEYNCTKWYYISHWLFEQASLIMRDDAKKELIKLKKMKGRKIICIGNYGYSWMGTWRSLKSSCGRNGQYKKVLDIIHSSYYEYWSETGEDWKKLKFYRGDYKLAAKLLETEIKEETVAVGVRKEFSEKYWKIA